MKSNSSNTHVPGFNGRGLLKYVKVGKYGASVINQLTDLLYNTDDGVPMFPGKGQTSYSSNQRCQSFALYGYQQDIYDTRKKL